MKSFQKKLGNMAGRKVLIGVILLPVGPTETSSLNLENAAEQPWKDCPPGPTAEAAKLEHDLKRC